MIFIGYKDNGYRFMCHTQGNVIFCSTQAIFDEGHFPKCPNSHSREKTPPRGLTPEIESSVPGPFGEDEPAPIPFPPVTSVTPHTCRDVPADATKPPCACLCQEGGQRTPPKPCTDLRLPQPGKETPGDDPENPLHYLSVIS